ncbi:hypothetical protein BKA65DRAFT_512972 [Rhexocercosporidium sp. MPI-PUGE-AT-0058]|nr:hypothetical protein BKA65DRAFT_512972 [Rhexocercosporidium sp. MPI-PUGE-AT-0058]
MNTSIPALDLCSIDGRRTSKELYIKIFVVHFIVITAYCHLLSVRSENVISWRPLHFFITTLNVIVKLGSGLIAIVLAYCYTFVSNAETLSSPFSLLLGDVSHINRGATNYCPLSTSSHPPRGNVFPDSNKLAQTIGRVLVVLAFKVQCIGALILYHRRRQHDAVTQTDQRIFELSCSGLVIAITTLGVILKIPVFRKRTPHIIGTVLETVILYLRVEQIDTHRYTLDFDTFVREIPPTKSFYKENALSLLIFVASSRFDLLGAMKRVAAGDFIKSNPESVFWPEDTTLFMLLLALYLIVVMRVLCVYRWFGLEDIRDGITAVAFLSCFCFVPVYMVTVRDFWRMFKQIRELEAWPVDVECPMLWSDPYANYIWWLA